MCASPFSAIFGSFSKPGQSDDLLPDHPRLVAPPPPFQTKAAGETPAAAQSARPAGARFDGQPEDEASDDRLLALATKADCNRTRDILILGRLASLRVARVPDRAAVVQHIRQLYEAADLRGDLLNVNRQIAAYQLSGVFGPEIVRRLGVSVVYALLPLIKRSSKTGIWTIHPGIEGQAHELVQRIASEHWTARQVQERVPTLFEPRAKHARKKGRRLRRLKSQIRRLPVEELEELLLWAASLRRSAAA